MVNEIVSALQSGSIKFEEDLYAYSRNKNRKIPFVFNNIWPTAN